MRTALREGGRCPFCLANSLAASDLPQKGGHDYAEIGRA